MGDPGELGAETVDLTDKPKRGNPPPQPVPTKVTPPTQPTKVPATATAGPVLPTSTPEPTATPTATPDAVGAFFLDIIEPEDGIGIVAVDNFEVIGRTSVDALVSVNDTFVDVAIDGTFKLTVTLIEDTNEVEVVASTVSGDESSIVLVIFFEPAA